ncbi:MAG: hypothetical protein JNL67_16220 [Planctomycetaceae bacterium]|nr:hypothetical protein [Planctomycetaceae bacterium]
MHESKFWQMGKQYRNSPFRRSAFRPNPTPRGNLEKSEIVKIPNVDKVFSATIDKILTDFKKNHRVEVIAHRCRQSVGRPGQIPRQQRHETKDGYDSLASVGSSIRNLEKIGNDSQP